VTTLILILCAQDLFERSGQRPRSETRVSPDRLDLRAGPRVDGTGTVRPATVALNLDIAPDLGCGRFDLQASFTSVFNKNIREELLGALIARARSELASSAMVFLCQMSPTVCDAIKHYRITAQDFLQMQYGACQSIEQLADGADRQIRARAMKECLQRKQAEGAPLDEAMRACQGSVELRGLRGQPVREIDLVKEVSLALGLSGDARTLLDEFMSKLTLSARKLGGDVKLRAIDDRYGRKRREYAVALTGAIEIALRGPVPQATLDKLAPGGAPPVTNDELQRLASMDGVDREIVVSMLASAMALAQIVREAGEVQSTLASAWTIATDKGLRDTLESEARRIEGDVRRLKEAFEMDAIVTQARLRADAAALARTFDRARFNTSVWRERDGQSAAIRATVEWGKACPTNR